jgi:hypothetical protein
VPELGRTCLSGKGGSTLEKFVVNHWVEAASFKINGRYHDINSKIKAAFPFRLMEPLHFGKETFVDIEDLNEV